MDTIIETLNKLLGSPPPGFEWLAYIVGCIIVIIAFSTFSSILSFIFKIISPGRRY